MPFKWYGVKTIYRWSADGKPRIVDRDYDQKADLVEERIVLFRARNFHDVILKAEKEARAYAKYRFTNPYGQKVYTQYLKACDVFELFEDPKVGVEVFSTTLLVGRSIPAKAIVDTRIGTLWPNEKGARKKFVHGGVWREFVGK